MKKSNYFIALILTAVMLASGCTPKGEISEVSGLAAFTYDDYITPQDENLDFGTITLNNESNKARAISIKNPVDALPSEDCIVYINKDYEKEIAVPENAFAVSLENTHLNNYKVTSVEIKNITAKSGFYLIFIGDYNLAFAKTVYTVDKEIKLNNLNEVSTVLWYPAVIVEDKILKITEKKPNINSENDGIYLYDAAYESEYTQMGSKSFVQVAIVNDKVVYIGEQNELISIPGTNGYLLSFVGDSAIAEATDVEIGQESESFYLNITEGSLYTLKIGESTVGVNNVNSTREAGTTVLFTPEYRYYNTHTNEWGYEYTISNGVVTAITVPATETSGSAAIPKDGFVISSLPDSSEFKIVNKLKIGDKVELTSGRSGYSINTLPFTCFNESRLAEYVVIYNSQFGKNTKTNEWGYEILVDKNGKIIDGDGDGNALIPEDGFVISAIGASKFTLLKLFQVGASVYLNDENKNITFVYSPMDDYDNALLKFTLLKESADTAKAALLDIDYPAVQTFITELETASNSVATASGIELAEYRSTVVTGVKNLNNLLIPSLAVEDRGAWHVLSECSDEDVKHTVELAVSLGLNYIIIDTWQSGYALYHTELDDVLIHPDYIDFDPLEAFIRIGHEYGLEIHSSFSSFMAGGHGAEYPAEHPTQREGWLSISKNGSNYGINPDGEFYTLNPYNPEVRKYLISIFSEVAEKYDVDGIHYDYIRFPQPSNETGDFGYNPEIIKAFQKAYSTSVNPVDMDETHALWDEWCQFRCDIVSSFVKECTTAVKKIDSTLMVTAAVFAGMNEMKTSIFQDASSWVKGGYIDGIFSMNYTPSIEFFELYGQRAISAAENLAYCGMGIGTFEFYSNDVILQEVEYSRENNAGLCFFTLDSLLVEQYKDFITDGIFKRKAVTTYSDEAFSIAVEDLTRRIDELYIPNTDEYDAALNELKIMLATMTKDNIADVLTFAEENLDGAVLERVSESLAFIKELTVEKGYRLN